ncbi:COG4223 family protein [Azospirillum sp.]|uniref:COG4223 family protein n=1 Tax=Azospirillum sp. TaxID=34012 RepID=UPI003D716D2F
MTSRTGSEQPESDPNAQPASDSPSTPGGTAVERIIERFGGIRPMAHKLDTPVTTVQGWKKRGAIPLSRHADLRAAAAKYSITLDEADLEAATPAEDRHAAPGDTKPAEPEVIDVTATAADPVVDPVIAGSTPETRLEHTAAEPPAIEPPAVERTAPAYTPPPPAVVEQRSGGGFATAVSLLALLVGAAALTAPWWSPAVPGWPKPQAAAPAAPAADPAVTAQVQQLNDRLAKLEQRPAPAAASTAPVDLSAITARIDALEKRPAPAAAPVAPSVDPAAVKALADRVAAVESKPAGDPQLPSEVAALKQQVATLAQQAGAKADAAAGAQALVLAAGQLRGALAGSGPFPGELQAVKALGSTDAELNKAVDAIAPHAAKGIPTQAQLADRLEREASGIVRAEQKGEGGSWVKDVTGTLSTLVTVRRQGGEVVGNTADAIVARAQAALNRNDLKTAVDEMSTLQGPAAQAAAGWLADAKARLAANAAGQQLTGRSIALLTAAQGGKVSQ